MTREWKFAENENETCGKSVVCMRSAAVPALTYSLMKRDAGVRMAAADVLGRIGPEAKAAVPALTRLLKDKDVLVRLAAAEALEDITKETRQKKSPPK